jgi:hypothetical protein
MNTNEHEPWQQGGQSFKAIDERAHSFQSEPELVHGGAFRRSFGDEWNLASERSSIQPRVPFQACGQLSRSGKRRQTKIVAQNVKREPK